MEEAGGYFWLNGFVTALLITDISVGPWDCDALPSLARWGVGGLLSVGGSLPRNHDELFTNPVEVGPLPAILRTACSSFPSAMTPLFRTGQRT